MKKGSHISEFHREKISAAQRGKKLTAEHKAKISATQKGKTITDDTKLLMSRNASRNNRCSINGKVYDSVAEAAEDLNLPYRGLCSVVLHHPERADIYNIVIDWVEQKDS